MPNLKNTANSYGLVAIVIHWLVALAVLGLFGSGIYMVELTYYDSLYNTLPAWHKAVGILLGIVMLLRFAWNALNPKPERLSGINARQWALARIVHWLMLILIVVIVISGYLIPTADGSAVDVFGWFSVAAFVHGYDNQADIAGEVHEYLAYAVIALAVLHALAALKHHFFDRDKTLKRMLGMK